MSWKASAYVKGLVAAPNGAPLTRSEKLLLLVLADYHDPERNESWPSVHALAADALMSRRWVIKLLQDLVHKGVITARGRQRADGAPDSNAYRFPFIDSVGVGELGAESALDSDSALASARGSEVRVHLLSELATSQGSELASSPKPPMNRHRAVSEPPVGKRAPRASPTRTDITPAQIEKLVIEFADRLGGPEEVRETIELARSHKARNNYTNEYAYVRNWLKGNAAPPPARTEDRHGATRRPDHPRAPSNPELAPLAKYR